MWVSPKHFFDLFFKISYPTVLTIPGGRDGDPFFGSAENRFWEKFTFPACFPDPWRRIEITKSNNRALKLAE